MVHGRFLRCVDLGNGEEIEDEKQIPTLLAMWGVWGFAFYLLPLPRSRDQRIAKFHFSTFMYQLLAQLAIKGPAPGVLPFLGGAAIFTFRACAYYTRPGRPPPAASWPWKVPQL